MEANYYKYPASEYIIMKDGSVARILKPTYLGNQTYYNLILDGKNKRINKELLMKPFEQTSVDGTQP